MHDERLLSPDKLQTTSKQRLEAYTSTKHIQPLHHHILMLSKARQTIGVSRFMAPKSTYTVSPHGHGFPKNDAVLGCSLPFGCCDPKEPHSLLVHTLLDLMLTPASAEPLDGRLHLMAAVSIDRCTDLLPNATAAGCKPELLKCCADARHCLSRGCQK